MQIKLTHLCVKYTIEVNFSGNSILMTSTLTWVGQSDKYRAQAKQAALLHHLVVQSKRAHCKFKPE